MGQVISPKKGRRLPVFVKEEEARSLNAVLQAGAEDWKSLNARMLVAIFYATGMRLSELIGLKEQQIDMDREQIKVLGKGNKERVIPVSRELLDLIQVYQRLRKNEFAETDETLLVTEKGK